MVRKVLSNKWNAVVTLVGAIMVIFQISIMGIVPMDAWMARATYFMLILVIGFLIEKGNRKSDKSRPEALDWLFIAMAFGSWLYLVINYDALIWRVPISATTIDALIGLLSVLATLELVRRTQGLGVMLLGVFFILYAMFGEYIPGSILSHTGFSERRIFATYFSNIGLYGSIMGITATYIFIFVAFGAVQSRAGVGDYFLMLANRVAGRTRGGPAKIAVIASSLMGTVSGSAAANVVATGSITIPMMKRNGYKPIFAAMTEAMASTGGQILPPVMGAGAFLMAELTGISYGEICIAAMIPALLYYINCFYAVDVLSLKFGYKGLSPEEVPTYKTVFRNIYMLFPLVVLIWSLLIAKYSINRVGLLACLACIVVSFVDKANRLNWEKIKAIIYDIAKNMVGITAITGVAGIVISTLTLTGLANSIARLLVQIAGGQLFLALLFAAAITFVLGMGMPTTGAYIIAASVLATPLQQLGIPVLNAHLFLFYFACLSVITPPVCVASFAAATIAGSPAMRTGWYTVRIALPLFIIPFVFVTEPGVLFQGDALTILYHAARCGFGVLLFATASLGYTIKGQVRVSDRVFLLVASLLFLCNFGLALDIVALVMYVVYLALLKPMHRMLARKRHPELNTDYYDAWQNYLDNSKFVQRHRAKLAERDAREAQNGAEVLDAFHRKELVLEDID